MGLKRKLNLMLLINFLGNILTKKSLKSILFPFSRNFFLTIVNSYHHFKVNYDPLEIFFFSFIIR